MKSSISFLVQFSSAMMLFTSLSLVHANGYYNPSYNNYNYQTYNYPSYNSYNTAYPSYDRPPQPYYAPRPYYYNETPYATEFQENTSTNSINHEVKGDLFNNNLDAIPVKNTLQIDVSKSIAKKTIVKKTVVKKQKSNISKSAFINKVLPIIIQENIKIKQDRKLLMSLGQQHSSIDQLSQSDKQWLKKIVRQYKLRLNKSNFDKIISELMTRVNTINPAMAMSQAAIESGWGKSRFTREANNIFGIWTYNEEIGLVPLKRDPDKKHFIRVFSNLSESVAIYMNTLNTHKAYQKLRDIRALNEQENSGGIACDVSTINQADGLELYSARGLAYVKLVKQVIEQNDLKNLSQKEIIKLDAESLVALIN